MYIRAFQSPIKTSQTWVPGEKSLNNTTRDKLGANLSSLCASETAVMPPHAAIKILLMLNFLFSFSWKPVTPFK